MADLKPTDKLLRELEKNSVQVLRENLNPTIFLQIARNADEAPVWWSPARDIYLRKFFPTEPFLCGAIYSVCSRNASYRVEFTGPEAGVRRAKQLLATANLFKGWQHFNMKVSLDLYTQDNFSMFEVIRPSRVKVKGITGTAKAMKNPSTGQWCAVGRKGELIDLTGQGYKITDSPADLPIGINHLDAAACQRTGDPQYPVIYTDIDGRPHKLAWYQVITLEDFPSGEQGKYDVGFCATSRALRSAQILRDISIYEQEKVSGRFAGTIWLTNVGSDVIQDAVDAATAHADSRGLSRYMPPIIADTLEPSASPSALPLELASLPDGFDKEEAMRWYIACLAIDFGVDYGFLAPLPGNKLGTSQQAEVAERQSRGKASRMYMTMMQDKFNYYGLLPRNVTMEYKEVDAAEEMDRDTAKARRAKTRRDRIESGEIDAHVAQLIAVDEGDLDPKYLKILEQAAQEQPEEVDEERPTQRRGLGNILGFGRRPRRESLELKAQKKKPYDRYLEANQAYERRLTRIYDDWVEKWSSRIAEDRIQIERAVVELVRDLEEAADDAFAVALILGYGREMPPVGESIVEDYLESNREYLVGSLAPRLVDTLFSLTESSTIEVSNALHIFDYRVSMYAQPHWTLIWEGVRIGNPEARVLWELDPTVVEHCSDCPVYAREYDSWESMIATTGGLPGFSNAECGPGCRCGVVVL